MKIILPLHWIALLQNCFNKDLPKYKIGYRSYSANEMVDYYKDLISNSDYFN